ncbi:hypothetical protein CJ030_MR1G008991 [Morella rubra]|uniref:Uncharacterized protein n=1 Tax=Morella rubra TaxID=262757 RepID=A0A6A1WLD1_9ROSI|nr:hypothetical protein CJ030_MR1G008991 [Morella rubra]
MQSLHRIVSRFSSTSLGSSTTTARVLIDRTKTKLINDGINLRGFSAKSGDNDGKAEWDKSVTGSIGDPSAGDLGWDSVSSWSTGLTKEHFDGEAPPSRASPSRRDTSHSSVISDLQEIDDKLREYEAENRKSTAFVDGWGERMREMTVLLKQVREPGARGSYLKDSEKAEMYRLHKQDPEVYTVERLAKDYRIMRQRVHAILWLKELEEEEEKKLGHPLDDSVELLLDTCPEFFNSHDREFHVASLPYKPDFKVMPEGWDGTTKDLDEVHYEISRKEDEMLYEEFVQRMNFNKKKFQFDE